MRDQGALRDGRYSHVHTPPPVSVDEELTTDMAKVLIVEDRASIRKFAAVNLASRGYEVDEAENGLKGLEQLKKAAPDVVLLDIKMPVMSGIEVLESMTQDEQMQGIPVVVMTASFGGLEEDAFPNIARVLLKPLSVEQLVSVVKGVIEDNTTDDKRPDRR
jgi:CheY-like chemotaxis protein